MLSVSRTCQSIACLIVFSFGPSCFADSTIDSILRFEKGTFEGWEVTNTNTWKRVALSAF